MLSLFNLVLLLLCMEGKIRDLGWIFDLLILELYFNTITALNEFERYLDYLYQSL